MHSTTLAFFRRAAVGLCLFAGISQASEARDVPNHTLPLVTNLLQLQELSQTNTKLNCSLRLEATVCAVNPDRDLIVLQDGSAAEQIELPVSEITVHEGDRVAIEAERCTVAEQESGLTITGLITVDNDGAHVLNERVGAVFLEAGPHPIRVDWFNCTGPSALELSFQGPGFSRRSVPGSLLFRPQLPNSAKTNLVTGLQYRYYEGSHWLRLPNFNRLKPVKSGTVANFDIGPKQRIDQVGFEFTGWLEIPKDGTYTFFLRSDDGARMFLDQPAEPIRITPRGTSPITPARRLAIGQVQRDGDDRFWAQVEGRVAFVSNGSESLDIEMRAGPERLRVMVADAKGLSPILLNHSRIRATGINRNTFNLQGQRVAGGLLVAGSQQIQVLEPAPEAWNTYPLVTISNAMHAAFSDSIEPVVRIRGQVRSFSSTNLLLADSTGEATVLAPVELQAIGVGAGSWIEVIGRRKSSADKLELECGVCRELAADPADLGLLTTAEQVKKVNPVEAQRGYPVKIRGVITSTGDRGFVIQDATAGVYVSAKDILQQGFRAPRIGDYWEVEGVTGPGDFAPVIVARKASRLGIGSLPEPLRPTWDQLVNGSLDTQYSEIEGVVTATRGTWLEILARGGKASVNVPDIPPAVLSHYQNALVRVRGCLFAVRKEGTRQLAVGEVLVGGATISVDEPVKVDSLSVPLKRAAELLLFDPRADVLQRVRVIGQILHVRNDECFMCEGNNGLRFVPQSPVSLQPGDRVEVAGFPTLGGPSPLLREATIRNLGHSALPAATPLLSESSLEGDHDSTLVRVNGLLVDRRTSPTETVLEIQVGLRRFVARLAGPASGLESLPIGARLELTGVYDSHGHDRAAGRVVDSFEILLNAPADVHVLGRPPWWTPLRVAWLFLSISALVATVLGVLVLRTRRKVREQIAVHRRSEEQFAAINKERNRLAGELHDTLEQSLTGVALQLNAGLMTLGPSPDRACRHFELAREMIGQSQDEVRRSVWDLHSRMLDNNNLPSALEAIGQQLTEGTDTRVEISVAGAEAPLPEHTQHHLFRIGQEAITNAVRHGHAHKIEVTLQFTPLKVTLTVCDDGRGFTPVEPSASAPGHFGLVGMRQRAKLLGATLTVQSAPNQGATIAVQVPLTPAVHSPI